MIFHFCCDEEVDGRSLSCGDRSHVLIKQLDVFMIGYCGELVDGRLLELSFDLSSLMML